MQVFGPDRIKPLTPSTYLRKFYSHMHKTKRRNLINERSIFDTSNVRSLVSLLPPPLVQRIRQVWASDDRPLFAMSEPGLRGELLRRGKPVTTTDQKIRLQFWSEYDRISNVQSPKTSPFDMSLVIGQAMAKEVFYDYILDNTKLIWILCPIEDYQLAMTECLRNTTERLQEFVSKADLTDTKQVSIIMKIEQNLYDRIHATTELGRNARGGHRSDIEEGGDLDQGEEDTSDQALTREERLAKIEALKKATG